MTLDLQSVTAAVNKHLKLMDEAMQEFGWFEAAYEGLFWKNSPFGILPKIKTKMETNMVEPFIATHLSNLYYRSPRTKAKPPAIVVEGAGRKQDPKDPGTLEVMLDDWLDRADVKEQASYSFQLALMFGAAAFKLCITEEGDALSQVVVDVIPRWECLWEEKAKPAQQTYRGHIRWERADRAEEITGAKVASTGIKPCALVDKLDKAMGEAKDSEPDDHDLELYVQLLEFYDLTNRELRFYLVDGEASHANVVEFGKALPLPWYTPDGRPALPIVPVVLCNVPHLPMRGVPAVRRIFTHNAEDNLLLSVVASGMRADAARTTAYKKDAVDEEFLAGVQSGDPERWIPVKADAGPLESVWRAVEASPFAASLGQYKDWITQARQSAQGFSDIMSGRQGKYLSATEAGLLADAGEATATEIGARMTAALGKVCEQFLAMLAATVKGSLRIQHGTEVLQVDRAMLKVAWTIEIQDSNSTPVKDAAKKVDLQQLVGPMGELVKLAAPQPEPPPAGPGQPPPPPAIQMPGEVRAWAAGMIDYMVSLYQLPESMKWASLQQKAPAFTEAPPKAPKSTEPEAPPEPQKISRQQAESLLAKAQAAQAQGAQVPPQGVV